MADQKDASLDERVDNHFHGLAIALSDTTGMMRHILDSLGALKHRLKDDNTVSHANVQVFGNAVKAIVDHLTDHEPLDQQSAIEQLIGAFPDPLKK